MCYRIYGVAVNFSIYIFISLLDCKAYKLLIIRELNRNCLINIAE